MTGSEELVARVSDEVTVRVPARVGLVGNPSDGYGGAVLATTVPGLGATVAAQAAASIEWRGAGQAHVWTSVDAWLAHVAEAGHGDEQRIVSAALWTVVDHLRRRSPSSEQPVSGISLSWHTDVPRSVGLAGSSAIAVAVIRAAAAAWSVPLDPRVVAALALMAEREVLGITAGWQDRIVQSFGRTVLVDAGSMDVVDGVEVPQVRRVDAGARQASGRTSGGASLVVGWSEAGTESSDDYHAPLRRSAEALASPMATLAALAREAATAWELGEFARVAETMGLAWRTRQACAPLRADHAALVESVRATGVEATTPGSGGSVVALCVDDREVARAREALADAGAAMVVQPVT